MVEIDSPLKNAAAQRALGREVATTYDDASHKGQIRFFGETQVSLYPDDNYVHMLDGTSVMRITCIQRVEENNGQTRIYTGSPDRQETIQLQTDKRMVIESHPQQNTTNGDLHYRGAHYTFGQEVGERTEPSLGVGRTHIAGDIVFSDFTEHPSRFVQVEMGTISLGIADVQDIMISKERIHISAASSTRESSLTLFPDGSAIYTSQPRQPEWWKTAEEQLQVPEQPPLENS